MAQRVKAQAKASIPKKEPVPTEPGRQFSYGLLLHLVLPLIVYKLFIYAFVVLSFMLLPPIFDVQGYYGNFHWPEDAKPNLETSFATWDAQLHLQLSYEGYRKDLLSVNHQPLWPLLIKIFSYLTFGSHLIAGLILSSLFSVAAFCLFYQIAREDYGERLANTALALMLVFPGAIFFSFVYTESLFLFLAVLLFFFLKKSNYVGVSIAAFLLPLTRIIGIFCVFPLAWHLFSKREPSRRWVHCLSPICGLLTYFLIMYAFTGDPFAGIEGQQRYITAHSISRIFQPGDFLAHLFSPISFSHGFFDSAFDRLWFVWLVLSLPLIWQMNRTYFVYAVFMGIVPAMTGWFMSYTRFIAIVFPLFLATAKIFANQQWQYWLWLTIAVLFSVQILFLLRHVNFFWVA